MKQQYADNGVVVPYTLIQAGPCVVTQVKTKVKDGYDAIQLGYGEKKKASKPLQGHVKGLTAKDGRSFACLKEMRLNKAIDGVTRGDRADVGSFAVGDVVDVTGTSKGKGFAGVVKRHHFHGHPTTHGHKDQERMPGSIGSGGVQHVFKGVRMAGRMGGEQVTAKKLSVVSVDQDNNIIAVSGAVPGARNGIVVLVAHTGDMTFSHEQSSDEKVMPSAPVQDEQVHDAAESVVAEEAAGVAAESIPAEEAPEGQPVVIQEDQHEESRQEETV